ncbi:MAG: protein kinase [Pirellulales bacterium]|nr:protein kinase [Pirellulales bacterium]
MDGTRTLQQGGDEQDRARRRSLQPVHPPTKVPGFEPIRFLGSGAFGEVWVAADKNTGRRVAIKFYSHRGGLDWSLLAREVEKLSFLFGDRHVVQLLEVGWSAEPPYYVMEYLERGSLEERLREGTLPATEAVALFRDVATGLVHAHGKGVLHCDLKPANILLDDDGKPRLADFGQSRMSHEQSPALGTLFFMAPEQADLEAAPDARWDVYALGALLYTMLVGAPPFRDAPGAERIEQVPGLEQRLIAYRELLRTSPRPARHRKAPGVDRALADIIDRCLSINPARRYPNVQAVVDALHVRSIKRARRPLLILGALGPAVLLVLLSVLAWDTHRRAIGRSEREITRLALESEAFLAQFVAKGVAAQIDERWKAMEQFASTERFRDALIDARDKEQGTPEREILQSELSKLPERFPAIKATSYFVQDATGKQLARYPFSTETIDGDYSFRDYFHGRGYEMKPGTTDIAPIRDVHRSIVFRSRATNNRMVAFSAPIWSGSPDEGDRHVIGVLAMTVELGHFAELRPEHGTSKDQLAVLVDANEDSDHLRGPILEHPGLGAALSSDVTPEPAAIDQRQATGAFWNEAAAQGYYLEPQHLDRLAEIRKLQQQIRELRRETPSPADLGEQLATLSASVHRLTKIDEYTDPVQSQSNDDWLAAIEPVVVEGRPDKIADTAWAVIIQQRRNTALEPVRELGQGLARSGLTGLAVVLGVVTALWGAVIIVMNESPRSRWLARFKRRVGLSSQESAGSSASMASSLQSTSPDATES